MHIFIMGICGTFMGSLAILAKELGYRVSGCDAGVYPPMSTLLQSKGIEIQPGFEPEMLDCGADQFVVGNAMSRGNEMVEALLNRGLPYTSGPQWLRQHVLQDRWVLAVAGTHGKTTTSTMLAWILEHAGMSPGFLIGGVPRNFDVSARLGDTDFFVIEADEYDSAFFDKRSKFVHYAPRTVILNNLEFDHADIFPDLRAIQTQFHHLVRIVPGDGLVIYPATDVAIAETLQQGCWSHQRPFLVRDSAGLDLADTEWQGVLLSRDGGEFEVRLGDKQSAKVNWSMLGSHNVSNAVAAVAAAHHVGVPLELALEALAKFDGVKRRMEMVGEVNHIRVYDDFAHHPTAIATTLQGLRAKVGKEKIIAVIEPRSNTMRMGEHRDALASSCRGADHVFWYEPANLDWQLASALNSSEIAMDVFSDTEKIIEEVVKMAAPDSHVVIMSNGGFEGIHSRMLAALKAAHG